MKKRLKFVVNGIDRQNTIEDIENIPKILRRKWVENAIKETDDFSILIYPQSFVEKWQLGGWSINWTAEDDNTIISLKDCVGHVDVYDINEMFKEKECKMQKEKVNLFEDVIAQAELIFLTNGFKDFECAFNHIKNRICYEKRQNVIPIRK